MQRSEILILSPQQQRELARCLMAAEQALSSIRQYIDPQGTVVDVSQWATRTFQYIYSEISAVAYMDESDQMLGYILLDTDFGQEGLSVPPPPGTEWIALVSNHPTGNLQLTEGDRRNKAILSMLHLPLRVYIFCDAVCIPVA